MMISLEKSICDVYGITDQEREQLSDLVDIFNAQSLDRKSVV